MEQIHINFTKFDSLIQIADYFHSEDVCKQAIAQERWGDGEAVCPYCGCTHTYMTAEGRYICKECASHFSVTVGTIFENTKVSLRKWFLAMYLVSSHKKGVSSHQLARDIKVTQKTAWFMLHKIRGLYGQSDETVLGGTVEMDEMYLGGRETNKHESKKVEGTQGRSTKTKTPVFGMMERSEIENEKGEMEYMPYVRAMVVENTNRDTILPIISQFVEEGSTVFTDELNSYNHLAAMGYNHKICNHGALQFVVDGETYTNNIEGFWSHFRRMISGCYHDVSDEHLQSYIDEAVYRWNTRKASQSERFEDMFAKSIGLVKQWSDIRVGLEEVA